MFDYEKTINDMYDTSAPKQVTYDSIHFKLPIEYSEHREINDIIKTDIELLPTNNIYKHIIPDSILVTKWSSFYSTDKSFLKDTQQHIKYYQASVPSDTMFLDYKKFKEESNFIEKYQYMSVKMLKPLNNYTIFLHFLGFFNLASPAISLLSPLFALIIPFVILKCKGVPITISMYIELIKKMIRQNSFIKLFTDFTTLNSQQKMSGIVSILFYIYQIYANIMSCIKFYNNVHSVSGFLSKYKTHIKSSILLCDKVQGSIQKYESYTAFYNEITLHKQIMNSLLERINILLPYDNTVSKLSQLGIYMHLYYDLYFNELYHSTFMYSVFLHQYDVDISALNALVKSKKLNKCKFGSKTKMNKMYYLPHIDNSPVKNSIELDKNIIITGPNASGKTTILKSILINTLLSQQIGYGCYSKATIKLYDAFHSYLNIPDTSGRDSLFQAEARRCKEILETITNSPKDSHLCIFDEIYSGTNPNDAVLCANLYLKGMNHFKGSVDYILTTHYIQLCENFTKDTLIKNLKMNVSVDDDKITYLYQIVEGISYIHGGKHILKEMNYPEYLFTL
jgi:energy-coupling factor transporter ATP-binding protein EcfA2